MREPYKYLDFFRYEDADLFFGRERETQKIVGEVLSARLLILFSPSGSGKTSLIEAGVRPELEGLGYRTVYVRLGEDPLASIQEAVANRLDVPADGGEDLLVFLKSAVKTTADPVLIFLDQFEEFFVVFRDRQKLRAKFIEELAKVRYEADLPVYMVLSLREDYFAKLHQFRHAIPSIFHHNANVRLERFSKAQSVRAIEGPLKVVGGQIDEGLADRIFEDLAGGTLGVEPIKLQIVCQYLWKRRSPNRWITASDYAACGGARKVMKIDLAQRLASIPRSRHRLMARLFEALKTPDATKRFRPFVDLCEVLKVNNKARLRDLLGRLVKHKLLRQEAAGGNVWYEFRHDYLVAAVTDWLRERETRLLKRRIILIPSGFLSTALLVYMLISYMTVYAVLTPPKYDGQQEEISIERGRPFGLSIYPAVGTSGLFLADLRGIGARNALRSQMRLGLLATRDWEALAVKLNPVAAGRFVLALGDVDQGKEKLFKAIQNSSAEVREAAISALENLRLEDERVLELLCESLQDSEKDVRRKAARALSQLGTGNEQELRALIKALRDPEAFVSSAAAQAIGELGVGSERELKALIETFQESEGLSASSAALALGRLGVGNDQVLSVLLKASLNPNKRVRGAALQGLGQLAYVDKRVHSVLLRALEDSDSFIVGIALQDLVELGIGETQVIAVALKTLENPALNDPHGFFRSVAIWALMELGLEEQRLLDVLLNNLRHSDRRGRSVTAASLGRLNVASERIIDALFESLRDPHVTVRMASGSALIKLGVMDERVVAVFIEALRAADWSTRRAAVSALGEFSASDDLVITALFEALRDSEEPVRGTAARALGDLLSERPVEELLKGLTSRDSATRIAAAQALVMQKTLSQNVRAKIEELRGSDEPWVRLGGSEAARLVRWRLEREKKAEWLAEDGGQLLKDGEVLMAARRYVAAFESSRYPIRLQDKAAQAAFQAARCYAKLGLTTHVVKYLKAAFEHEPALRETFVAELALESSDWTLHRGDRRLERLLSEPQG